MVVIPAELRNKYHWKTGDRVNVVDYGGVVSLVLALDSAEEEALGAGTPHAPSVSVLGQM